MMVVVCTPLVQQRGVILVLLLLLFSEITNSLFFAHFILGWAGLMLDHPERSSPPRPCLVPSDLRLG